MAGLSSYGLRIARLSARIFGDVARHTDSKSMKVVELFKEPPLAQRKEVYDWYPPHKSTIQWLRSLDSWGFSGKLFYSEAMNMWSSNSSVLQLTVLWCCFRDEHQDFKEEMRRLRKLRGKGKPKKGEGKRAAKKK